MYLKKILLAIALIGLVVVGYWAYTIYDALFLPNTAFEQGERYVYVPSDASFPEVMQQLDPLLEDQDEFRAVARRKRYINNLRPGRYALTAGMNNNEIVNTLRSKNLPLTVSFNNQERLEDLAGRIGEQLEADSLELLQVFRDTAYYRELGLNPEQALAMYLPNSYEFFWNTSASDFRDRMRKEYERFWTENRLEQANAVGLDPAEVIALAAIVQKETAKVDERPRVAGVYLNRLKRGMPLQADPTVIYAIKKASNNFDTVIRRVLYRDLALDSPYNTYKYRGVPPGPISMPDLSSIKAVLQPEKHEFLYFVADVENFGYHKFAKTLRQHNRNKAQYVRWINQQNIKR